MRQFSVAAFHLFPGFTFSVIIEPADRAPVYSQLCIINYQMELVEAHATGIQ